jgi:hypothetical protein
MASLLAGYKTPFLRWLTVYPKIHQSTRVKVLFLPWPVLCACVRVRISMLEQSFDRESGTTGSLIYVTPGGTKAFSLDRRAFFPRWMFIFTLFCP